MEFAHDKHTLALKKEGCEACHPKDSRGRLSPWLGRLERGTNRDALIKLYHGKCVTCHKERSGSTGKELPLACGECHDPRSGVKKSAWREIAFDYSLHSRHVRATGEKQCKTCHHVYNKDRKALEYKKGAEGACGDCHGDEARGKTPSLRRASHQGCVTCHLDRASKGQQAGPVSCDGCHDGGRQAAFKKLPDVSRLSIGQQDRVKIKTDGARAAAVTFDHKLHEQTGQFCTTCHHRTIKACGECHTRLASKDGGGVSLEQAHHSASSRRSCVGCHKTQVRKKECAGCHHALDKTPGERSCAVCHRDAAASPAGGPATMAALPNTSEAFPETVKIEVLANKYLPSLLPHKKIVDRLDRIVRGSKLAMQFHGRTEVLCAGCHHHSPVGQRPTACKSCHGDTGSRTRDRPSLKAAYHRQCIGCHQKMGIKEQGCTDCHAKAGGEVSK